MEKSRAIELLKLAVPIKALTQQEYADFVEAVNMAIDALKAQLSSEDATSDTISRQAALDIFDDYNISVENGELEAYSRDRKRLCELQSVQPVATDTNVGDTISRQATIDAVNNAFDRETLLTGFVRSIAVRAIRDMPSAQPEPQWIPCEERMPEAGQTIIAQCRANIIKTLKLDSDGDWYQDAEHCYMSGFVVAWMPLPKPFEGGAE